MVFSTITTSYPCCLKHDASPFMNKRSMCHTKSTFKPTVHPRESLHLQQKSTIMATTSSSSSHRKRRRIKSLYAFVYLIGSLSSTMVVLVSSLSIPHRHHTFISKTTSFATMSASIDSTTTSHESSDDPQHQQQRHTPSPPMNHPTSRNPQMPLDTWIDRTTTRLLDTSSTGIPLGTLTIEDVQLLTTLMHSHAKRATVSSAITCERLLKRVVDDVNAGNTHVATTTKMYTVAMDAWAKSQRRPLPQGGNYGAPTRESQQKSLPLGAAAQRAHRIHTALVSAYQRTGDVHLAPSAVSYNAAINAWSKSYHPSGGEMAELLLSEMMREWRFGELDDECGDEDGVLGEVEMSLGDWNRDDHDDESNEHDESSSSSNDESNSNSGKDTKKRGNTRVRPDVVTFTAVIDAWVKCTALAHDYNYERPSSPNNNNNNHNSHHHHPFYNTNVSMTKYRKEKENYAQWKKKRAAEADELTKRAATRAKQLLSLMIRLSHYDPNDDTTTSLGRCEPTMRPNCYTYSAVMNALAKSCSALRAVNPDIGGAGKGYGYDPAKEAQDMLESMIERYERYRGRVGEPETWNSVGYRHGIEEEFDQEVIGVGAGNGEHQDDDAVEDSFGTDHSSEGKLPKPHNINPRWFDPRPDEITFPPNTINYNSVLNAWSRASRYDSQSALRAEQILLERMERPQSDGGDAVEPDALSYSLVIHAWLRGCRGVSSSGKGATQVKFTDRERIHRAILIADRMEAWARRNHQKKLMERDDEIEEDDDDDDDENKYSDGIIDELDSGSDVVGETGDDTLDGISGDDEAGPLSDSSKSFTEASPYVRAHDKARHLDVEVYNSIIVAYLREMKEDHAADVMRLLDRMEAIAEELDMPSVRPNQRSYNVALDVISKSATRTNSSLAAYYEDIEPPKIIGKSSFNPLYAGRAAESLLSRMLSNGFRPDAYSFASVLNTYQRIPNGKLDAALAADGVVRGMESLHLHGKIDDPPDVFHYTMVCACWSRSGEQGVAGERCSEILRHMHDRDKLGFARTRPNIRTYNAVIDAHAHNGRLPEAEDMLRSMVDAYESSAARSIEGIEDEEIPVRPDSFSFNTVIQQWARSRSPDGGRRAEAVLDLMMDFHQNGNADVRPDDRSFAFIIHHYTKGSGRMAPDAPDKALAILRKMIKMYSQGYKDVISTNTNRTTPIFAFTSVIDAHSVLRRADAGIVADELLNEMIRLGRHVEPLRPNTYTYLSVLYAWSSCGTLDAGQRATEILEIMERDMELSAKEGRESIMRTTQRCYVLAQTAWARSPSEKKAEGALKVLEMMERNFENGNKDARPTVQAYSMVINACAFADTITDAGGNSMKATPEAQLRAFRIAESMMDRFANQDNLCPTSMTFGTFIKCCGRLDLPSTLAKKGAIKAFGDCCRAGLVSDFVITQMRYALTPEEFLNVLVQNGYENWDSTGKMLSRDGKRMQRVRWNNLPASWRKNVDSR